MSLKIVTEKEKGYSWNEGKIIERVRETLCFDC
jgi:hypothetical protein